MARNRQRAKQRQQQRREQRLKQRQQGDGQRAEHEPEIEAPQPEADAHDPGDIGRVAAETGAPPQNLGRSDATGRTQADTPPMSEEELDEAFLDEEDFEVDQEELDEAEEQEGFAPRGRRGDRPATGEQVKARGAARVVAFLRACWAELQRVQWPDRRQLTQLTAIVLVFIVIMGGYLGILDAIVSRVIQEIL
jgi:preprotein translocase SecE subunit